MGPAQTQCYPLSDIGMGAGLEAVPVEPGRACLAETW